MLLITFWLEKLGHKTETQHWNLACLTLSGPKPRRVRGGG